MKTNSEKMKKNEKPQTSHTLTDDLGRRMNTINRRMKNVDTEIAVLKKRKQKYVEGLPKVEKALAELNAKKKLLMERQEKELGAIRELSKTFLQE